MPPKAQCPTPSLRWHNGAWKIIWRWEGTQYSVSTGLPEPDKLFAEQRRIEFAIALKKDHPEFPIEFRRTPSVVKYTEARYGHKSEASFSTDPAQWLDGYMHEIRGKNTKRWISDSLTMLGKLKDAAGELNKITEPVAASYMAGIAARRSAGTHNRTLTVFKKFYGWLLDTKRHTQNPFSKIKRMNEGRDAPIVYCSRAERDEIIVLALSTGWPEWIAILIAFMTGMRRGEIANLRYEDIRFDNGVIHVKAGKTKTIRTFPLNEVLEEFLLHEPDRQGYVVKVPEGEDRLGRLNSLTNRLKNDMKEKIIAARGIIKPPPSKAKDFKEKWRAYEAAVQQHEKAIADCLERIGWNSFRHTFGSLLAQAGVSLDKISAWMGNTPEVCRRHYAQFIPRDRRDSEIDKL